MIGKPYPNTLNPTVYTSPWDTYNDPTAQIVPSSSPSSPSFTANTNNSPYLDALLTAISRYLPSNETDSIEPSQGAVESDEFRMYEFKVRGCTRPKAHDWTECPFAHPGEKARRRDPRRFSYSGTACADFRKGSCRRGDACEFAHGVFECWLHPTRYRTQVCKDGPNCTRRVCFFAHAPGQLRVTSGLPSPGSIGSGSLDPFEEVCSRSGSVGELVATLGNLQLSKVKSMPTRSGGQVGLGSPRLGLSDGKAGRVSCSAGSVAQDRVGFYSLPGTPTRSLFRVGGVGYPWEEEPIMKREEPARIGLDNQELMDSNLAGSGPDIGWVSELVK